MENGKQMENNIIFLAPWQCFFSYFKNKKLTFDSFFRKQDLQDLKLLLNVSKCLDICTENKTKCQVRFLFFFAV